MFPVLEEIAFVTLALHKVKCLILQCTNCTPKFSLELGKTFAHIIVAAFKSKL